MTLAILEIITGFILALISSMLLVKSKISYSGDKKERFDFRSVLFPFTVYLASDITMIILIHHNSGLFESVSMVMLANILFILAIIDIKKRVIPNRYIFTMLILRVLSVSVYGVFTGKFIEYIIILSAGAVTGFFVTGIISLISRKSLGAGDVKMFAMIGAFTGITGVIDILIYSAIFCAAAGMVFIAMKKCTIKSCLPMAPFGFMGTILFVFLGCV